ncbi:MAG TPA: hypothetical protein VIV60_14705, partial [Polyangiaceae bacterium]
SMLILCHRCHRYVKHEERRCPFCGNHHPNQSARQLGIATAVALGFATTVSCGGGVDMYGPPPMGGSAGAERGSSSGGNANSTATDQGGMSVVPVYGAPPSDQRQ